MIHRLQQDIILGYLKDNKALILMGARQVGKTTILESLKSKLKKPIAFFNGDEADVRQEFEVATSTRLKKLIGSAKTVIIDEAQRIENIGIIIKLIVDNIKDVKVIATGSSSFDLANKISEPLTGRKWEFQIFPLSFEEMVNHHGLLTEKRLLEHRMLYGYYPEIVTSNGDEILRLKQLADSYLFKDILIWERILKPEKLEKLLQALALQIGNEVSYNELSQLTGLDNQTVENYIQILEKAFIVFRLNAFNRNLRNELKKSRKIYFYDTGIRNVIINQFSPLSLRTDKGALWENFLVSERMKFNHNNKRIVKRYFWRNHAQQEIDYLEEKDNMIHAFEIKWDEKRAKKFPQSFLKAYEPKATEVITTGNFDSFIC
ncbi:ATP-binding protein [Niabella insulamsoli]|uniref:ATP-binding protein n=1 Tax=Niabella insulamsoli TaxID=3144874 RepID=UPI0031FE3100